MEDQVVQRRRLLQLIPEVALVLTLGSYQTVHPTNSDLLFIGSTAQSRSIQHRAIPFEFYGNRIYLPVKVNGSGPFRFILDTGASVSVINQSRSQELGVKAKDTGNLMNVGAGESKTRIYQARDVSFSLQDGNSLALRDALALPMDEVEIRLGGPIYGALGFELFDRYAVELNYPAKTLTLYDPKTITYSVRGEAVPIIVRDRKPTVSARIAMAGTGSIEGTFVIDTGSGRALGLSTPFIEKNELQDLARNSIPTASGGVGGDYKSSIGRATSFQLGKSVIETPTVVFSQAARGATTRRSTDGDIGGEILRRFIVIFNYTRKQMVLEPQRNLAGPIEGDMSGAFLIAEGRDFKTLRVDRVFERTPAAEAGLREGDVIQAIGTRPATEYTLEDLREMFRNAGSEYLLSIQRNGQILAITVKMRRLV